MFKVQIENQNKELVISFRAETLEEAKTLAEEQVAVAFFGLVDCETVTAFVWNLTLGGIDAVFERSMDENGWLN